MALNETKLRELRDSDPSEFGNRVWAAIKIAETKQGDVADALGFTQPYLSKVCRGRFAEIGLRNANKLADHFGCTVEDLFPSRAEVAS